MLAIYLRNSPMLDNNVESVVTLTKPCKGIAEYTFLLCNSTPIRARCELRFSVDLKSKWFALGGQHWQQQQELDDLLPIIAYAGALIVEKWHFSTITIAKRAPRLELLTQFWLVSETAREACHLCTL